MKVITKLLKLDSARGLAALVGIAVSLNGCVGTDGLKRLAAPHVACPVQGMDILSARGGREIARFDVECSTGEVYECASQAGAGFDSAATVCELLGTVEYAKANDEPSSPAPIREAALTKPKWTRVHLDKCGASVLMPEATVARDVTLHDIQGQAAIVESEQHEAALSCWDFAQVETRTAERLISAMIEGIEATGIQVVRIDRSDDHADFVARFQGHYHRGQLRVKNDWGYVALIGPMENLAAEDVRRFVASVEVD